MMEGIRPILGLPWIKVAFAIVAILSLLVGASLVAVVGRDSPRRWWWRIGWAAAALSMIWAAFAGAQDTTVSGPEGREACLHDPFGWEPDLVIRDYGNECGRALVRQLATALTPALLMILVFGTTLSWLLVRQLREGRAAQAIALSAGRQLAWCLWGVLVIVLAYVWARSYR